MSFDLTVQYAALPADLGNAWRALLAREGFDVELYPGFTAKKHPGGFLTMRLARAPKELIGLALPGVAIGGFEVDFEADHATFRFGLGGPTTQFALMCIGAALLAELTGGTYVDPQSGTELRAPECLELARMLATDFAASADPRHRVHHPFPGWAALGCDDSASQAVTPKRSAARSARSRRRPRTP